MTYFTVLSLCNKNLLISIGKYSCWDSIFDPSNANCQALNMSFLNFCIFLKKHHSIFTHKQRKVFLNAMFWRWFSYFGRNFRHKSKYNSITSKAFLERTRQWRSAKSYPFSTNKGILSTKQCSSMGHAWRTKCPIGIFVPLCQFTILQVCNSLNGKNNKSMLVGLQFLIVTLRMWNLLRAQCV